MKNLSALFFLIIISLFSCSNDEDNTVAYYQFTNNDLDKLLNYQLNQEFVYKNENGEERVFKVSYYNQGKARLLLHNNYQNPTYTDSLYYFDYLDIWMSENDTNHNFLYSFRRYPNDSSLARENIYNEYPSHLTSSINSFPYWNANASIDSHIITIDFTIDMIEMSINEVVYDKVLIFNSGNPNIFDEVLNINIIYYDVEFGIIGFDDLDGNHWRIE